MCLRMPLHFVYSSFSFALACDQDGPGDIAAMSLDSLDGKFSDLLHKATDTKRAADDAAALMSIMFQEVETQTKQRLEAKSAPKPAPIVPAPWRLRDPMTTDVPPPTFMLKSKAAGFPPQVSVDLRSQVIESIRQLQPKPAPSVPAPWRQRDPMSTDVPPPSFTLKSNAAGPPPQESVDLRPQVTESIRQLQLPLPPKACLNLPPPPEPPTSDTDDGQTKKKRTFDLFVDSSGHQPWRDRPGNVDGGRYGTRGGRNSEWWAAKRQAQKQGRLEEFLRHNPRPT